MNALRAVLLLTLSAATASATPEAEPASPSPWNLGRAEAGGALAFQKVGDSIGAELAWAPRFRILGFLHAGASVGGALHRSDEEKLFLALDYRMLLAAELPLRLELEAGGGGQTWLGNAEDAVFPEAGGNLAFRTGSPWLGRVTRLWLGYWVVQSPSATETLRAGISLDLR